MPLSCSCPDFDGDGWFYYPPDDFTTLDTSRRKRCCSCNELIDKGNECLKLTRYRGPQSEIEWRIQGDEVAIAPWWMCAKCGEQFLNLNAYGYCIPLGENMFDLLAEHREEHGITLTT